MISLVRKRHPAPGWVVLEELSNSTGGNVRGRADAVAFGIWPSHGFEMHTFEFKQSREDLKKELKDPSKSDTIGAFGDYFWLIVSDIKLIETLVLPATWGVLTPKQTGANTILSVVKKATKQEAKSWSRGFVASIIRHVHDGYVTKREYDAVKETAYKEAVQRVRNEQSWQLGEFKRAHEELLKAANEFQAASGIDIRSRWQLGDIGAAVRMIIKMRENQKYEQSFLAIAEQHEHLARAAREAAAALTSEKNNTSTEETESSDSGD